MGHETCNQNELISNYLTLKTNRQVVQHIDLILLWPSNILGEQALRISSCRVLNYTAEENPTLRQSINKFVVTHSSPRTSLVKSETNMRPDYNQGCSLGKFARMGQNYELLYYLYPICGSVA